MELSQRARRVQLRLDSGQIVGAADRLGMVGLPATSAAILDLDQAFAAGKLPASLVDKLEEILQKLAAKVSGNGSYHLRTVNNVIHVRLQYEAIFDSTPVSQFLCTRLIDFQTSGLHHVHGFVR